MVNLDSSLYHPPSLSSLKIIIFFVINIPKIRTDLEELESSISPLSVDINSHMHSASVKLKEFELRTVEKIEKFCKKSN